jgi:hypothetical protein
VRAIQAEHSIIDYSKCRLEPSRDGPIARPTPDEIGKQTNSEPMIEQSCSGSILLACRGRIAFFDVVRDKENEAVGGFMTGAGIIHRDPRGAGKRSMQDVASLVDKAVLAGLQSANGRAGALRPSRA